MNERPTIADVDPSGLCHGCGTCAGACPAGAIRMAMDERRGVFHPVLAEERCTGCGRCREVCPGRAVDFDALNRHFFGGIPEDAWLGHHRRLVIAHARDERIRFEGSSGGLVTALLIGALRAGRIDGAVVTRMDAQKPLEPQSFIARTEEELRSAAGSKYGPTSAGECLGALRGGEGRVAFVGVPCQIHGLRKWQMREAGMGRKVPMALGLMCSNTATCAGTEHFLRRWGIHRGEVKALRFREPGWLRSYNMAVELTDGRIARLPRAGSREGDRRSSYLHHSVYHADFILPRCLMCLDHAAELADLSFGDPRLRSLVREDSPGESLVVVRSAAGAEWMDQAVAAGQIEITHELDVETFRKAQSMAFKMKAPARLGARRRLGLAVPAYGTDRVRAARLADVLALIPYAPSYLAVHPRLRPLIRPWSGLRYGFRWMWGRLARVAGLWRAKARRPR